MTCDQAGMMLEKRWDSALSPTEERALDDHIQGCAACREEMAAIAMADMAFQNLPDFEPPINIAAAVAARIASEEAPAARPLWEFGALALLAALLTALWRAGFTPATVLHAPAVSAVAATLGRVLEPVTLTLAALGPLARMAAPYAAALLVFELGLMGFWAIRRTSRDVAGWGAGA